MLQQLLSYAPPYPIFIISTSSVSKYMRSGLNAVAHADIIALLLDDCCKLALS